MTKHLLWVGASLLASLLLVGTATQTSAQDSKKPAAKTDDKAACPTKATAMHRHHHHGQYARHHHGHFAWHHHGHFVGHHGRHHHMQQVMLSPTQLKWSKETSAKVPAGAEIAVLEGNPDQHGSFTIRVKLPAGYQIPAHFHRISPQVTVLSGSLHLGTGDKLDKSKAKTFPAGSFVHLSGHTANFAWTEEATVLQIHGYGPWHIHYVNPADNPEHKAKTSQ